MIRSFPPHPNPLPPGERGGHSSPQQSWGVFWHILIKRGEKQNPPLFCFKRAREIAIWNTAYKQEMNIEALKVAS
jgi:hypothetical protein